MATHDLNVGLSVGNSVALSTLDSDEKTPDVAVVLIAPAHEFQRADGGVNWPVAARYATNADTIGISGLHDKDSNGDDVVWEMQILWKLGRETLAGYGPVTFKIPVDAAATISYPEDVTLVDPVSANPDYGPTYLQQTLIARGETFDARDEAVDAAASVERNQPGGVAGLTTGGTLYEAHMPARLTPSGLSATIQTQAVPAAQGAAADYLASNPGVAAAAVSAVASKIADARLAYTLVWEQTGAGVTAPTITTNFGTPSYDGDRMAVGAVLKVDLPADAVAAIIAAGGVTVEVIAKTNASSSFPGIFAVGGFGRGPFVSGSSNNLYFTPGNVASSKQVAGDNLDHHIAFTATLDGTASTWANQTLWADGAQQIAVPGTASVGVQGLQSLYIGGSKDGANTVRSSIRAVRISRGVRYSGAYTPPTVDFTVDHDTIAVLHMNTGPNVDVGGQQYPARPAGARAGSVTYIGPNQPSDWVQYDQWIEVTA